MKRNEEDLDDKTRLIQYLCYFVPCFLSVGLFVYDIGVVADIVGLVCAAYCYYKMSQAMPISYMVKKLFFWM